MGWVSIHWGVFQDPDAITSLPHKVLFFLKQGGRINMWILISDLANI
jgi:hypothetical protein